MNTGDRWWEAAADGSARFSQAALPIGGLGALLRVRCVATGGVWGRVGRWYGGAPMDRLLRPAAALAVAATIPFAAACGGGSGGDPSADPAAIVPARAAVYIEANLKPGDDVTELAKKLSGEDDPGGAIKSAIEKEARETDKDFKYADDIEPWLGDKVGIFLPRVQVNGDSPAGLVAPTKDADKAKEFLERELRSEGEDGEKPQVVERTHRDTKYLVDTSDDEGVAIVDDYAVFGSDAAIKGALDAQDGESLAESSEYEKARDAVKDDRVGFMYVRLSQIFSSLGQQGAAARQVFSGLGETIAVGLDGDPSSIRVESAALGTEGGGGATSPGKVLADLPASAWLAAGVSDVGGRIDKAIEQFSQLGALGGQNPEQLLDQLEARLGIDPRRDLAAWLGDVGIFAFGDSPAEIGGGLVATTKDAGATRRSIPRIARFLEQAADVRSRPLSRGGIDTGVTLQSPGLPLPVHMALTDDERFIVVVTDAALAQTLQKTDALGDSKPFQDASGKLGEGLEPSLFVNFGPLAALVEASGAGGGGESADRAKKALERLTTLVAGAKQEGDTTRGRVVVGVK